MDAAQAWEYCVVTLGSWIRSPKDGELTATLNELGEDGWQLTASTSREGSQALTLFLQRPLGRDERRRRSRPGGTW
ncbi:MAG TPA: hypothetical protein VFI11_06425 [Anaerolineales bacterium]|nr:hypothetical protein [Anaerolineales bacterium]